MTVEVSMPCDTGAGSAFLLLCERETTLSQLGKVCRSKTWPRSNIVALNLLVRK